MTRDALPGDPGDDQSRYIEAAVNGMLIGCIYLPNGNPQPGPKFDYKLEWFKRLAAHAAELLAQDVPVVLAGDYNVAPTDTRHLPDEVMGQRRAGAAGEPRRLCAALSKQGWTDAIRTLHPDEPMYTLLALHAEPLAARRGLAARSSAAQPVARAAA